MSAPPRCPYDPGETRDHVPHTDRPLHHIEGPWSPRDGGIPALTTRRRSRRHLLRRPLRPVRGPCRRTGLRRARRSAHAQRHPPGRLRGRQLVVPPDGHERLPGAHSRSRARRVPPRASGLGGRVRGPGPPVRPQRGPAAPRLLPGGPARRHRPAPYLALGGPSVLRAGQETGGLHPPGVRRRLPRVGLGGDRHDQPAARARPEALRRLPVRRRPGGLRRRRRRAPARAGRRGRRGHRPGR